MMHLEGAHRLVIIHGPLPQQPTDSSQVVSQATFAKRHQSSLPEDTCDPAAGAEGPRDRGPPAAHCVCLFSAGAWRGINLSTYMCRVDWGRNGQHHRSAQTEGLPSSPHLRPCSSSTTAQRAPYRPPEARRQDYAHLSWGLAAIPGTHDLVKNRKSQL